MNGAIFTTFLQAKQTWPLQEIGVIFVAERTKFALT
jgi:hypothetical protein